MEWNTTTMVRKVAVNGNTTSEFKKGVRQGCPLSLATFNIVTQYGVTTDGVWIRYCIY
jgi:hypothetical protein